MRRVGMDDARVARQLVREREPGVAGGEEDVAEDAAAADVEAAVDGGQRARCAPSTTLSSQPLRARSSSTCRRNSGTVGR